MDEVKPLKFTEIEVSYEHKERRLSKGSDSETESECSRGRRRKHQKKCSHKRRTSSCSEMFICHRADESCGEINRSKSTTELHSRRRHSKSHRNSTSSESESSQNSDSDDECCYHVKRKHRCYKKVRGKSKERDGSNKRDNGSKKGSESSECKENDKDQMRVRKDKKKVEIASSGKKSENKSAVGGKGGKAAVASSTKASVNKKRPPSAKNIQKKGSQDEKMNRSIDKPKTPDEQQQQMGNDGSTKTSTTTPTTNEEVSEDDKGLKEITTQAEVHATETLQTTDVDEGVLTDATYTIEKREISEIPTIKEEVLAPAISESNKKVSFKSIEEEAIQSTSAQPVELPSDEKLKASSPLPPEILHEHHQQQQQHHDEDELPENIQRPKSQTPESIGSFTVLEDGDDADEKLKEFEEMTQDEGYRHQTMGEEDESEEQQYFDDSSSMEKLPRRSKGMIDDGKDQDSGIEPSPRAQPRTKIPGPRFSHSSAAPMSRRAFIVADDRPRSTRIEGRKPGDKNACNMTTVTQSIQKNIRR